MDVLQFALTLAAKGAVVLVMAAVASAVFARGSAALRHMAWSAGLCALLLLPALTFILPEVPVARWTAPELRATSPVFDEASPRETGPALAPPAEIPASTAPVIAAAPPADMIPAPIDPAPVEAPESPSAFGEWSSVSSTVRIFQIWGAGAALLLLWLALGHLRAARLARRASPAISPEWAELVDEASMLAGLTTAVEVRESTDLTVPATVGVVRPVVLVPESGVEWSFHHRRDVLIHEFAHVLRRDCLTHSIGWIACALHWMNPLAWVALWRTRVEREHACDDIVLRAGARPSEYAEELLQTAHLARIPLAAGSASLAMARRSQLSTRLLAILDAGRRRNPISSGVAAALGFGTAVVVLPVAALAPAAAATPEKMILPVIAPADLEAVAETPTFARGEAVVALDRASAPSGLTLVPAPDLAMADETPSLPIRPLALPSNRIPVVSISEAQGQSLCATSKNGSNRKVKVSSSMSFSGSGHGDDGDGNSYVVWSGPDCSVTIHVYGEVEFNEAETDVASLGRSGRFVVTHSAGNRDRRYEVRRTNGELERRYFLDDRPAEMDAEAERWRGIIVLEYIRRSGHDAENRARRILAKSGVEGVLNEIEQIESDWGATKYFLALLASGRMDDASTAQVLTAAGQSLESDHYLAQVLGAVSGSALNGTQTRAAYLQASDGIESDHYLSQTITRVLSAGSLDPAATRTLLERAGRMESDHYLAQLLTSLRSTGTVRGELLADYLAAAKRIESDHYKVQVLGNLVPELAGRPELLASALDAAQSIDSDHYLGEYLKQILMARALEGPSIEPFFSAAKTIESDHYLSAVLVAALGRSSDTAVVTRTLEAAPSIESDHYLAEVLMAAKRRGLTEQQQVLWRKAADAIESDHYFGKVVR